MKEIYMGRVLLIRSYPKVKMVGKDMIGYERGFT
jgi:hypothetical protein